VGCPASLDFDADAQLRDAAGSRLFENSVVAGKLTERCSMDSAADSPWVARVYRQRFRGQSCS